MNRILAAQLATLVLAIVFAGRAAWRVGTLEFSVLQFAVLGLPPWAVWAVSAAELGGALLVLWRRTFFPGVLLLLLAAGLLAAAYFAAGFTTALPVPAGLAAMAVGVALLRVGRPGPLD
jgi:hypothetical protein